ncbi:hypothetical protein SNEBB_005439 [Seison nebaliae]|nr:hypothetical protein SNEBB_005439 [Seison nebaliae]
MKKLNPVKWSTNEKSLKDIPSVVVESVKNVCGFDTMTPIQTAVIPLLNKHKDVVGEAVTGSGKTLAYVIPILSALYQKHIDKEKDEKDLKNSISSIIIVPTRELAKQVYNVMLELVEYVNKTMEKKDHHFKVYCATGGQVKLKDFKKNHSNEKNIEKKSLLLDVDKILDRKTNILVGTPGRIVELLEMVPSPKQPSIRPLIKTSMFDYLILDEADLLLKMGFKNVLTKIFELVPKQRRTGLFSATQFDVDKDGLEAITDAGLRNPVKVTVNELAKNEKQALPQKLHLHYAICESENKLKMVVGFLKNLLRKKEGIDAKNRKIIIFFSTIAESEYFYECLKRYFPSNEYESIKTLIIHRKLDERKRKNVLNDFVTSSHRENDRKIQPEKEKVEFSLEEIEGKIREIKKKKNINREQRHRLKTLIKTVRKMKKQPADIDMTEEEMKIKKPSTVNNLSILLTTDLVSRGIDFDNIEWIIHFDVPVSAQIFIHRCGRTARIGNHGNSLLMLMKNEETYLNYMKKQSNIQMNQLPSRFYENDSLDSINFYEKQIEWSKNEADMCYRSNIAFVSFIQSYTNHTKLTLFGPHNIEWFNVGKLFGLLRLPAMTEVNKYLITKLNAEKQQNTKKNEEVQKSRKNAVLAAEGKKYNFIQHESELVKSLMEKSSLKVKKSDTKKKFKEVHDLKMKKLNESKVKEMSRKSRQLKKLMKKLTIETKKMSNVENEEKLKNVIASYKSIKRQQRDLRKIVGKETNDNDVVSENNEKDDDEDMENDNDSDENLDESNSNDEYDIEDDDNENESCDDNEMESE